MKNVTGKLNLLGMNAKQLVEVHNDHAADAGAKTIGKWTGKTEVLRQRTESVVTAALKARTEKANAPKKPRGLGIGARVKELLHGGTTDTNDILAIVKAEIPEANITDKCVRWYASKEKIKLTTVRLKKAS